MKTFRFAALTAILSIAATRTAAPAAHLPKLAVIIVVDQMRADYIDRFQADWTAGLKRIVSHGAWFHDAAYPYLGTVTCAGHATVSTGTFPNVHGVFANAWWDRKARELITCTEDSKAHNISYGPSVKGGESPRELKVSTFTDQMREQRSAHVVTLSLKARSAIMLAGHGGDAVTWLNDTLDGWASSSAYTKDPVAAVKTFVDANPIDADYGKTWTHALPDSRYQGPDDGLGESAPRGWERTFPHRLTGGGDKPDAIFHQQWEASPFADAYLGRMAASLAESFQLGKHDGTDVLGVSFSSTDIVGHDFGPRSQEVQDMYVRLDRTVGALLDRLDALVGRDEYVVALTADHGVSMIPDQAIKEGRDAGRITAAAIVDPIEKRMQAALGSGKYIARMTGNDLYFEHGQFEKLAKSPEALAAVIDTIAATPGIARVFRADELRGAADSHDPLLRAAALSYVPDRSGDLIFALKPGWMIGSSGTTHGSASPDDQHVPVVFMGRGVKPGRYTSAATPADVTPTLAALCGATMADVSGHILRAAIAAPAGTRSQKSSGGRRDP